MTKNLRKRLAMVLVASMIATQSIPSVFAQDFTNHWASTVIAKWQNKGLLKGYEDGTFRPNNAITRAEFATLLVRLFGYTETKNATTYTDVAKDTWYANAIQCVSSAGLIYEEGTEFRPNDPITREEAAYALAKAYAITGENQEVEFADENAISEWAAIQVEALHTNGYIQGDTKNAFNPKSSLTRAEFLTMTDRMTAQIINTAGTYTEDVAGNLIVNTRDVVLKDMVIEGNLYLAAGIGDGDVHLEGIEVKGQVIIEGGGENSIKSKHSKYHDKFVVSAENPVRVVVEGDAVKIEAMPGTSITLTGNFEDVIVPPGVEMKVQDATVKTIYVSPAAKEDTTATTPTITLDKSSKVDKVQADSSVDLKGDGKVSDLVVNAPGVTTEKAPEKITIKDKDLTVNVAGKDQTKEDIEKPSTGSSSSSDDSDSNDSDDDDDDSNAPVVPQDKYLLQGYVTYEGEPVEYALVQAYSYDNELGDVFENDVTTDEFGYFSFYLESGETYELQSWIEDEDGYGYYTQVRDILLNQDRTVNVELKKHPVVNFTVVDKNDVELRNVKIQPTLEGHPDGWSHTDNFGEATCYMWNTEQPYGYQFYINDTLVYEIPESVTVNEDLKHDIKVILDQVGLTNEVDGQVIDEATGQLMPNTYVVLKEHTVKDPWGGSNNKIASTVTDSEGNFSFDNLNPSKRYYVEVETSDAEGNYYVSEAVDPRFLPYQDNTLSAKQSYTATVKVVDKNDKPLPRVSVGIEYERGGYSRGSTEYDGTRTFFGSWQKPGKHVLWAELDGKRILHPLEMVEGTYNYTHTFKFDVENNSRVAHFTVVNPTITVGDAQITATEIGIQSNRGAERNWGRWNEIKDGKASLYIPEDIQDELVSIKVLGENGEVLYEEFDVPFTEALLNKTIDLATTPRHTLSGHVKLDGEVTTGAAISIAIRGNTDEAAYTPVAEVTSTEEGFIQTQLVTSPYTVRTEYTTSGQLYISTDTIYLEEHSDYLDIELKPAVEMVIYFKDEEGNPIVNTSVEMNYSRNTTGNTSVNYITDEEGKIYILDGLDEGQEAWFHVRDTSEVDHTVLDNTILVQDGLTHTFTVQCTPRDH